VAHQWLDDTAAVVVGEARPTWTFPSGAKIVFGYLAEHNVQRYLGSEWHAIFLDECTEITRLRRVSCAPDCGAPRATRSRCGSG
jgi:hypothetical protein